MVYRQSQLKAAGFDAFPKDTDGFLKMLKALQAKGTELYTIKGLPPDLSKPMPGCAFAARCEFAAPGCITTPAELGTIAPGHAHACIRARLGEL
jgi:oligopeptide transport system ATP-binding protein